MRIGNNTNSTKGLTRKFPTYHYHKYTHHRVAEFSEAQFYTELLLLITLGLLQYQ